MVRPGEVFPKEDRIYRRQRSGFDRVPYASVCNVAQAGIEQRALLCNLSIVGAYVHTERPPAKNSEIELRFELPDGGPPVRAGASVTWVNEGQIESTPSMPHGFGARFLSASPDDIRRIANVVANFLSGPEPQYQVGVGLPPSGKARIPFVAPCRFHFDKMQLSGSVCNLSTLGAYATFDRTPKLGARGELRFAVPGLAGDFEVEAAVAWLNPAIGRVQMALPPGCGFAFERLSLIDEAILSTVVEGYLGAIASELRPARPAGEISDSA